MSKKTNKDRNFIDKLSLSKSNYIVFFVGVFVITLGYILMATGGKNSPQSLSISPIVLLIGYLIIIPISIFIGSSQDNSEE